MNIFSGQVFEVKGDTSRSELLGALKQFGFFSGVEFECKDPSQSIFFVREVGVLERLGKMFRSVLSKNTYRASGDALLALSQKNLVLAGILGRSVFDAREKIVSARELNDRLKLGEKKLRSREDFAISVPLEGKLIVTDALSLDFGEIKQVDLTNALSHENFRDACNTTLSQARAESTKDVLIVRLGPVSDNDEPSDEAINKLLLVIDEHQKSNPSSRLMITTDGDRLLYERLLNLKVQHDTKKISQSNKLDLSPMDLLMLPAWGNELKTLNTIDVKKLKKYTTQFNNVSVCITNKPEMIQSDLSILNSNDICPTPQNPDDKPAAASKLISSIHDQQEHSAIGIAFKKEKSDESKSSTLSAARFPAMDLPVKRLILFEPLRGQWRPGNNDYEASVDKVKKFYLEELRREQGLVVIQSPVAGYACEGLRRAVDKLREENEGPTEILITTPSDKGSVFDSFKPSNPAVLTG